MYSSHLYRPQFGQTVTVPPQRTPQQQQNRSFLLSTLGGIAMGGGVALAVTGYGESQKELQYMGLGGFAVGLLLLGISRAAAPDLAPPAPSAPQSPPAG